MLPPCTIYTPLTDSHPEEDYPFCADHMAGMAEIARPPERKQLNHDNETGWRMLLREMLAMCVQDIAAAVGAGLMCPDTLVAVDSDVPDPRIPARNRLNPRSDRARELRDWALEAVDFIRSNVADDIFADITARSRTRNYFDGEAAIRNAVKIGLNSD